MVKSCAAYNCTNRVFKNCGISFHSFPKDLELSKKWIIAMKRDKYKPSSSSRLCSDHFTNDDFVYQFGRKLLKKEAVPSLFKFPNHLQKKEKKLRSLRLLKEEKLALQKLENRNVVGVNNTENGSCSSNNLSFNVSDGNNAALNTNPLNPCNVIQANSYLKKRKQNPVYFGDCDIQDINIPKKAQLMWNIAAKTIKKQKETIKYLQTLNRRLRKRINTLDELIENLKNSKKISTDCYALLQECVPASQKQILLKQLKITTEKKYPPELRCFALTLNFYSSSAYNYARRVFNNCLPHPSTLRKWYTTIDGSPGYTRESLQAIQQKVQECKKHDKQLICGLQMDEMAIKQHIDWNGRRQIGYINYGYNLESDSLPVAKDVLVFLIVGLNCRWKIPIGYFLISGLSAEEKANLVKGCLLMLNDTGAKIISLTFDGAHTNIAMAQLLGAQFTFPYLKTFFEHPSSKEKIFIMLDPCHMIKLIRNALGDLEKLKDTNNNYICWHFFKSLVDLQEQVGLHLATKIRNRHLHYYKEKMNVRLAVQVFSNSTADALTYCSQVLKLSQFQDAEHTANFCLIMDRLFDPLNTRNTLSSNPFKRALSENNFSFYQSFFADCINYISNLKTLENVNILNSRRKTGFLGMIITMKSIETLVKDYIIEKKYLDYLLSYKISQDHIELFFSAIRTRGGFNNNPTARQFEGAYKRLLVHVEVKTSEKTNCTSQSDISILTVSSFLKSNTITKECPDFFKNGNDTLLLNHDSMISIPDLDCKYVDDVVGYIAGFVARKIFKIIDCKFCRDTLITNEIDATTTSLISIKNKGGLMIPSRDLLVVCKTAEKIFRTVSIIETINDVNQILVKCLRSIDSTGLFSALETHILDHDPLQNHRNILLYFIIKSYINVRIHYKNSKLNEVKDRIRHSLTKLVHFKHQ